jgi:hypothetical protein
MQRTLLNTALAIALAGFSLAASAQFSGAYAPGNWTVTHSPDAIVDQGSVAGSASSITLTGSDTQSSQQSRIEFWIDVPFAGLYSFNWQYATNDIGDPIGDPDNGVPPSPPSVFDVAGYTVGGTPYQLSTQGGASAQSGQVLSLNLAAGTHLGFYVETLDNLNGAATFTVSNFTAPVPEPATMVLMAMGLAGLGIARRRRAA